MALAEPWHLKSRAHECSSTERPFAEGEPIFTAIFPSEEDGFERRDYTQEGWDNRNPDESPQPFSFWRSTYQPPVHNAKPEVVAKESAEDLLRRLVEEDEEGTENVRYIIAVMLERKKLLRETDQQRTPSGILRIYEHRKTGEVLIIRDPDIPLDKVEEIQTEVIAMLESGGRPPEAESAEEPAEESENSPETTEPENPERPPTEPEEEQEPSPE